jgi:protein SCO1/2
MRRAFTQFGFLLLVSVLILGTQKETVSHDPPSVGQDARRRQLRLPVKDFSLTDQTGAPFRFHTLQGKVVVLTFMYTTCPDVCPLLTANMRVAQEKLTSRERQAVHFLSITTDPEIDSPKVLKSYADRYKVDLSNWLFLTGAEKSLQLVWKMFGVKVERKARGLVNHTTLIALIDKKGAMRFAYSGAAPDPKIILQDVRKLLGRP